MLNNPKSKKSQTSKATAVDGDGQARKKKKASTSVGCPFSKPAAVAGLRDDALLQVQDIEQLVAAGKASAACPYYASRAAVKDAQVVVVPYQTLLHKGRAWPAQ